jgi:hypothetical protein
VGRREPLAPEAGKKVAGLPGQAAERLPNRLEPGAQLFVARFHRQHRVLKARESAIRRARRLDRAGDETGGPCEGAPVAYCSRAAA